MSNFWGRLDVPLFNCEVYLTLTWSKDCIILSKAKGDAVAATELSAENISNAVPGVDVSETNATFEIKDTQLYVPVATLSTEDDNNFWKQLKSGFKRTIKWRKYRSEMTNQTKNNNLNYLIQRLIKSIDYLSYHSKMKKTEHLFQRTTHQIMK